MKKQLLYSCILEPVNTFREVIIVFFVFNFLGILRFDNGNCPYKVRLCLDYIGKELHVDTGRL